MQKNKTRAVNLLYAMLIVTLSHASYAEPTYSRTEPLTFPSPAVLDLHFDNSHRLLFQWQAAEGATIYHLQERSERSDRFVDLAANIPAKLLSFRMPPSLYGRSIHHYRLLSCNISGCNPSNVITLYRNTTLNLVDWLPPQRGDLFGAALSLSEDGTMLAVGSPSSQVGHIKSDGSSAGSVYLFSHNEGHWSSSVVLKASKTTNRFGYPVQLDADGQVLTVGSSVDQHGVTHVFTRKSINKWRRFDYSPSVDNDPSDYPILPNSLSKSGKVLAIANQYEFVNHPINAAEDDSGFADIPVRFVQVFERDKTGWQEPQFIWPSRYNLGSAFGYAISLSGNGQVLAIGAPVLVDHDDQYSLTRGAVHLYQRSTKGHWRLQKTLHSIAPHNANFFGYSISLNGNGTVLAIGAFEHGDKTPNKDLGTGMVQLFTRTATTDWQLNQVFTAPTDQRKTLTLADTLVKTP